jgi:hypothetical protein
MKKKSQLFCTVAAFLLTFPILNGCSSKQTQTFEMQELSETETTSTETLSDGQTQTSAKGTESITVSANQVKVDLENREAPAEARDTLMHYMDAMQSGDYDTMAELSDFLLYVEYMGTPEMNSEESPHEVVNQTVGSLDSYEITDGYTDAEILGRYKEAAAKKMVEAKKRLDDPNESEEKKQKAEMLLKMLTPVDNLCFFSVKTIRNGGTEDTDYMYLLYTEGKWKVSLFCADILVSSMETDLDARPDAQNAYNAMNFALADLDACNYNVIDIDKTLTYHGSDFANLKPAELNKNGSPSASETLALLPYLVLTYFNRIEEVDTVVFAIENGICQAAAWKLENGNYDVYPYPHDGSSIRQEYSSAEDALASVKEYLS